NVKLSDDRVLVQQVNGSWNIYGDGPDQVFGTADDPPVDVLENFPGLDAAQGDKVYAHQPAVMLDLTSHHLVPILNQGASSAGLQRVSASGPMIFGKVVYAEGIPSQPGAYSVHGEQLAFQVADLPGENAPSGGLDGDFYVFVSQADNRVTL